MTAIERGDIVIINDFDEPSARMCAVVTQVEPDAFLEIVSRGMMNECATKEDTQ